MRKIFGGAFAVFCLMLFIGALSITSRAEGDLPSKDQVVAFLQERLNLVNQQIAVQNQILENAEQVFFDFLLSHGYTTNWQMEILDGAVLVAKNHFLEAVQLHNLAVQPLLEQKAALEKVIASIE